MLDLELQDFYAGILRNLKSARLVLKITGFEQARDKDVQDDLLFSFATIFSDRWFLFLFKVQRPKNGLRAHKKHNSWIFFVYLKIPQNVTIQQNKNKWVGAILNFS